MNDLDSLFESVRGSAIADVIKDSKIILVTEFDGVHPLKTGEYWFEEESNTLYVGAGDLTPKPVYVSAISYNTSVLYIPSPRIKTSHLISLPNQYHTTNIKYIPSPRIKIHKIITIPTINNATYIRVVNKNNIRANFNINLPIITYSTTIQKI